MAVLRLAACFVVLSACSEASAEPPSAGASGGMPSGASGLSSSAGSAGAAVAPVAQGGTLSDGGHSGSGGSAMRGGDGGTSGYGNDKQNCSSSHRSGCFRGLYLSLYTDRAGKI